MMRFVRTGKPTADLYVSMLTAMVLGRVLAGFAKAWIFTPGVGAFAWVTTSLVMGIPGIVIQLVLMPVLVLTLTKAKLIPVRYAERVSHG
jgi:niacin transporter